MDEETKQYNDYARRITAGQHEPIPGVQLTLLENYSIRRTWQDGE